MAGKCPWNGFIEPALRGKQQLGGILEINLVRTKGLVQEEKEGVTTREEWSCPVPVACRSFLFGKVFHVVLDSPPPQVAAAVPANHGAPSRTRNVHPVLLPPRANGAAAHPQTEPHWYVGQGFLPSPPQARVGSLPAVTLEIVQDCPSPPRIPHGFCEEAAPLGFESATWNGRRSFWNGKIKSRGRGKWEDGLDWSVLGSCRMEIPQRAVLAFPNILESELGEDLGFS